MNDSTPENPSPKSPDAAQPSQEKVAAEDLDFIADSKAAFLEEKMPWANAILFAIIAFVVAFFAWACYAEVTEITKGHGKVIPSGSTKLVQSLEGGILTEAFIKEGQVVEKGAPLIQIDDTILDASFQEAISQRDNLTASIARLEAEAAHKEEIVFPEQLHAERPDLIATETQLFTSRRESVKGRIAHLEKSLAIKAKELEITRPLAAEGIVSQVELLRLENSENDIQGQIIKARTDYLNQVLTERNDLNARLEQINETLRAYRDKITRSMLRSPVRGIVNKVHFSTPGSVIRPSEPIVEIVPVDDTLLVKARVSPADIAFIGTDQEATVKLTAYDFSIYGGLEGTVEQISADTFEDERGDAYYEVKVRTGGRSLRNNDQQFEIMPGMTVEVDIKTGKKTILEYLLKPLLRARMNSFSER